MVGVAAPTVPCGPRRWTARRDVLASRRTGVVFREGGVAMRMLSCREAGMDCDEVITGQSDEEVLRKAVEHGRASHGMAVGEDLKKRLKPLIKNQ
jgi:predicted small metal-binding protein